MCSVKMSWSMKSSSVFLLHELFFLLLLAKFRMNNIRAADKNDTVCVFLTTLYYNLEYFIWQTENLVSAWLALISYNKRTYNMSFSISTSLSFLLRKKRKKSLSHTLKIIYIWELSPLIILRVTNQFWSA